MSGKGHLNLEEVASTAAACKAVGYYMTARLLAQAQGVEANLPPQVESIAKLLAELPTPNPNDWAGLANGELPGASSAKGKPTKPKPAAGAAPSANGAAGSGGDGDEAAKRHRGKWTEDAKAELVRLIDDEEYRVEKLVKEANRAGSINWAALARHFGFAGNEPLRRQYKASTGKEPPYVARPHKKNEGEEKAPAAKKQKTGEEGAAAGPPPAVPPAVAAAGPSGEWPAAVRGKLVRLVEDEDYRKEVTGKRHLKWSRIGEALGKGKKESRAKYTEVTGKKVDE